MLSMIPPLLEINCIPNSHIIGRVVETRKLENRKQRHPRRNEKALSLGCDKYDTTACPPYCGADTEMRSTKGIAKARDMKVRFRIDTTNTTLNNNPSPRRNNSKRSIIGIDKKVSFDISRNKEYLIWHVSDIENIPEIWYVQSDYQDILVENKDTLHLLRNRFPERRNFCFRGLECNLPVAARTRHATIAEAGEIIKVYQTGNDAELAKRYAACTIQCHMEAYRVGLEDAKVARAILSPSSMENNTPSKYRHGGIPKSITF
jgi:hypothetical protein